MNLREAITLYNTLMERRGYTDGSGSFMENGIKLLLSQSNNWLYNLAVDYGPTRFFRATRFTYPSGEFYIDLETILGSPIGHAFYLGTLESDADPGEDNMPYAINWERRVDIEKVERTAISGNVYLEGALIGNLGNRVSQPLSASLLGSYLKFRSVPTSDVYCYLEWAPEVLPNLQDDHDVLLGGHVHRLHEAVVLHACWASAAIKGEQSERYEYMLASIIGPNYGPNRHDLLARAVRDRQRQQPHQLGSYKRY